MARPGTQLVAKGSALTVKVYFPDAPQPITIDEAIVRWTEGSEWGVELVRLCPNPPMLSDYLSAHYPAAEPPPAYGLSSFSYNRM
jgi:hypothetical protein